MELTAEQQRKLIEGAKSKTREGYQALMVELDPLLYSMAWGKFKNVQNENGAVWQRAGEIIDGWLAEPESPKIKINQSLNALCFRALSQAAQAFSRKRRWERGRLQKLHAQGQWLMPRRPGVRPHLDLPNDPREVSARWEFTAADAMRAIAQLPESHREILITETQRGLGGSNRSLAQILRTTTAAARMRLVRARRELLKALQEKRTEEDARCAKDQPHV